MDGGTDSASGAHQTDVQPTVLWYDVFGNVRESHYFIEDDLVFIEDDLVIGSTQDSFADDAEYRRLADRERKAILNDRHVRTWSSGVIQYRVDSAFDRPANAIESAAIDAAVASWNNVSHLTGLRWEERPGLRPSESGVYFERATRIQSDRCFAKIGRHIRRKEINLGSDCVAGAQTPS